MPDMKTEDQAVKVQSAPAALDAATGSESTNKMNITKITIGRLYNLGSYEHVRYELTAEVPDGESAATALLGLERIITALSPKTSTHSRPELEREHNRIEEMRHQLAGKGEDEFRRIHGHFVGTPSEYIDRCAQSYSESVARRDAWEARSEKARKLLDDLGGAANWRDAKLDWQSGDDFDS